MLLVKRQRFRCLFFPSSPYSFEMRLRFLSLFVPLFLSSCLTYYQQNAAFESKFEAGQLEEAEKVLAKVKEKSLRKTLVLYKLNQGVIHSLMGDYTASNAF